MPVPQELQHCPLATPAAGVLALVSVIATLAVLSGIAWVTFGVQLHRFA